MRSTFERQHRVRPGDAFGLLRHLGHECAGAVQLTADDSPPGDGHLVPLEPQEVDRLVGALPTLDPPAGQVVSASLGGVQAKVLLTRTDDGWAWPAAGALSTHLVKPEPANDVAVPHLVRWEDWALRLARASGLRAAHAQLSDFDGRLALVVERYGRSGGQRLHQEDLTQALGIAARDKDESSVQERRLRRVAREAGAHARLPAAFAVDLLEQVTFNLLVGNGDAHSKNYSLLVDDAATFAVAPLYDVAPVYLLDPVLQNAGHALDGQVRLPYLTGGHLVREASTWGLPRGAVVATVAGVAARVRTALPSVGAEVIEVGPVAALVDERAAAVLDDVQR